MDEEETSEDKGFKLGGENEDEILDPLEEGAMNDFRFDEENDDDPDNRYH